VHALIRADGNVPLNSHCLVRLAEVVITVTQIKHGEKMYFASASARSHSGCRFIIAIVCVAGMVCGLSACSEGADLASVVPVVDPNDAVPPPSQDSMADFLIQNMDYGTLVTLLENAELDALLREDDNMGMGWTLFAPSDNAFANEQFESLAPAQQLALIRSNLYSGRLEYSELTPGTLTMYEGSVEVQLTQDGIPRVGGATIVARDRSVANGIIHFVNQPLSPVQ